MHFLLIIGALTAGQLARQSGLFPGRAHGWVNRWIIAVALPSVALHVVPSIRWDASVLLPFLTSPLVFAGAWLFVTHLSRRYAVPPETRAALLLTAGLGNTSFIGFPLTQAYFGDEGLRIAVMCDQGSFFTLSTLGTLTALHAAHGGNVSIPSLAKKVAFFPPFIGFLAAVLLPAFVDLSPADPLFSLLASTLVPLALFSVGLQLNLSDLGLRSPLLAAGLAYKLLIAPLLLLATAAAAGLSGVVAQVSVFEAAMPPMITAAILAAEHRLDPALANRMAGAGIVLSFVSSAVWWYIVMTVL